MRATLELIGEHGPDAVTHRAVAERAGLPLSATTYWFDSKEELLQEIVFPEPGITLTVPARPSDRETSHS